MKTRNVRGRSKSSKFAGPVGQEIHSKAKIYVWKFYWSLILGIAPVDIREASGIEQKEL